ncbi:hypothetical protein CRUP_035163, partial [Coryphaenoides rupestris]
MRREKEGRRRRRRRRRSRKRTQRDGTAFFPLHPYGACSLHQQRTWRGCTAALGCPLVARCGGTAGVVNQAA